MQYFYGQWRLFIFKICFLVRNISNIFVSPEKGKKERRSVLRLEVLNGGTAAPSSTPGACLRGRPGFPGVSLPCPRPGPGGFRISGRVPRTLNLECAGWFLSLSTINDTRFRNTSLLRVPSNTHEEVDRTLQFWNLQSANVCLKF